MKLRIFCVFIIMIVLSVATCLTGCSEVAFPVVPDNGITDTDDPVDDPTDDPVDDPTDDPVDDPTDDPTDDPVDNPTDDPVDDPVDDPTDDPVDDPTDDPVDDPVDEPENTKVTVYYSNNKNWRNVYAYVWNYATEAKIADWPGQRLTSIGTSELREKQYKIEVDYSRYDRIIFNDGGNGKTKDLVVSAATSGYYGEDGVFTMNASGYGKVIYKTLSDSKNLNYLPSKSKKISVYTPPGYSKAKKYGVLYMFDSQNLYMAADGWEQETKGGPERWAVDVGVTSLVKNGADGVIIVGIDNADGHRDQELTMSLSFGTLTELGGQQYGDFRNGKLDELGNFIKQTVTPWVKANYSVDTSREKTGIAGSSSGGLAAYYLGLRDNDVYGYIGAFSPANGIFKSSDWTRFYNGKNGFNTGKPKVYVYCGQGDRDLEDKLLPETKRIKSGLTAAGIEADDITENYVNGGTHNEVYWRIAFGEFLGKHVPR